MGYKRASQIYRKRESPSQLITKPGIAYLRDAGFFAMDFAHYTKMPKRVSGWPDVFAARHGTSWLIEVKSEGDYLRQTQINFFLDIEPHLDEHLRYVIAESTDDFIDIIEGNCGIVTMSARHLKKIQEARPWV